MQRPQVYVESEVSVEDLHALGVQVRRVTT